jgi:tellurite resistance protein TehA-like permease
MAGEPENYFNISYSLILLGTLIIIVTFVIIYWYIYGIDTTKIEAKAQYNIR